MALDLLRAGKRCALLDDAAAIESRRFYVAAACHGTGLRSISDRRLSRRGGRAGRRSARSGEWERNSRAIRYCEAQRFLQVGRQVFVLGMDPQQDVVMVRQLRLGEQS